MRIVVIIGALLLGVPGLFILGSACFEIADTVSLLHQTKGAAASVERIEGSIVNEGDSRDLWVLYTTEGGEQIRTNVRQSDSGLFGGDNGVKVGTTVEVRYYPGNPMTARLSSWNELWYGGISNSVFGVILLLIMVVALFKVIFQSGTLPFSQFFTGVISSTASTSFVLITKKQRQVTINVNAETKYRVRGMKDTALPNLKAGDEVFVLVINNLAKICYTK